VYVAEGALTLWWMLAAIDATQPRRPYQHGVRMQVLNSFICSALSFASRAE
jgi:hypothetical protein